MTNLPSLSAMTSEEKDALIMELWQKNQELESKLKELQTPVKKTSKSSSTPPSQDPKPNDSKDSKSSKASKPHQKGGTCSCMPKTMVVDVRVLQSLSCREDDSMNDLLT